MATGLPPITKEILRNLLRVRERHAAWVLAHRLKQLRDRLGHGQQYGINTDTVNEESAPPVLRPMGRHCRLLHDPKPDRSCLPYRPIHRHPRYGVVGMADPVCWYLRIRSGMIMARFRHWSAATRAANATLPGPRPHPAGFLFLGTLAPRI